MIVLAATVALLVVDGDTVVIDDVRYRIANMDAPELHSAGCDAEQRLAMVAKRRMDALLRGGKVTIRVGDPLDGRRRDRHGRTLATIEVDGSDVAKIMIGEGLARPWEGRRRSWCN